VPRFAYTFKGPGGEQKTGVISAKTQDEAVQKLRKRGLALLSIEEKPGGFELPGMGGVKTRDLVIFTRTFVTMLEAGLPIVQGLHILAQQQTNKTFKRTILGVKDHVEQGATLADSLRRYPKVFNALFVNLVEAGEAGGVLDTVLNRLSVFLEKQEKIAKQIKGAMTYPVITLVIAFGAVAIMLVKVIPTFEKMFSDFGRELPGATVAVIGLSHWMQDNIALILAIAASFVAFIKLLGRFEKSARMLDLVLLKFPLVGAVVHKGAITRFTQTLGTLLSSGVPIVDALEICKGVVGNRIIVEDIQLAIDGIREGKTLTEPLQHAKWFPQLMIQMVEVGESTGRLDQMLERVSQFYEEEVEAAVEAMTSAIEPIMMVFLGGIVGSLLIAMYLPIFTLAGG
jgi:type IV pilus assembly protein PilC